MTTITDPEALPSADNEAAPGELPTVPHWKAAPFGGEEYPHVRCLRSGDRTGARLALASAADADVVIAAAPLPGRRGGTSRWPAARRSCSASASC